MRPCSIFPHPLRTCCVIPSLIDGVAGGCRLLCLGRHILIPSSHEIRSPWRPIGRSTPSSTPIIIYYEVNSTIFSRRVPLQCPHVVFRYNAHTSATTLPATNQGAYQYLDMEMTQLQLGGEVVNKGVMINPRCPGEYLSYMITVCII